MRRSIRRLARLIYHRINFTFYKREMLNWISSKEFEEKYLSKKHPYPPLLNPDRFNHHRFCAELAWEFNMPLPSNYQFIFLAIHCCGALATSLFFRECDIATNGLHDSDREIYINNFKNLISPKNKFVVIWTRAYRFEDEKLYWLITKEVPALCVVRDPISILKVHINHLAGDGYKNIPHINLGDPYEKVILPAKYSYENPSPHALKAVAENLKDTSQTLKKRISLLKSRLTKIHYISFDSLGLDKAFDLFCDLSREYGFARPNRREIFETKINGADRHVLFPFTLHCEGGLDLLIVTKLDWQVGHPHYVDLTNKILKTGHDFPYKIHILIDKSLADRFMQNSSLFEKVSLYINGYMNQLEKQENEEKSRKVKEEDLLDYLQENKELREEFKRLFYDEYEDLLANRKDIVETWNHYNRLENMN